MLVKINFHGIFKKLCPDEYLVEAETPAEAIRGVTNQLKNKLLRKDGMMFSAMCKECGSRFALYSHIPDSENPFELNLYPTFAPSGGGNGFTQIIVGALMIALVVAAVFLTGGAAAFATMAAFTEFAGTLGMGAIYMGAGMILSGLIQTLMPQPKVDTSSDSQESSRTFGSNSNTTKIGTRIPIGYGKYKLSGQYLSINTQAVDRG